LFDLWKKFIFVLIPLVLSKIKLHPVCKQTASPGFRRLAHFSLQDSIIHLFYFLNAWKTLGPQGNTDGSSAIYMIGLNVFCLFVCLFVCLFAMCVKLLKYESTRNPNLRKTRKIDDTIQNVE